MTTHIYDPTEVDVLFALVPISGFSDDSMVEFAEDEDGFILVRGVDGNFTRSKIAGRSGVLTISLMQSSRSNDVLTAIYTADMLKTGGAGVVPTMVRDKNGTSLIVADKSWVIKPADQKFGKQAGPREWKIQLVGHKNFIGGTN
jgi:hypothetical protein